MTEHEYIRKEYLKAEQFDESREMIEKHSIMSRHGKNDELIPPFFFSTSNRGNVRIHKGNYIVNTYPNNWDVMSSSKLEAEYLKVYNISYDVPIESLNDLYNTWIDDVEDRKYTDGEDETNSAYVQALEECAEELDDLIKYYIEKFMGWDNE